jgi:hypothetical protein
LCKQFIERTQATYLTKALEDSDGWKKLESPEQQTEVQMGRGGTDLAEA